MESATIITPLAPAKNVILLILYRCLKIKKKSPPYLSDLRHYVEIHFNAKLILFGQ